MSRKSSCLSPVAFGLASGIVNGLAMMLLAWAGHFYSYGKAWIDQLTPLYHGYTDTVFGGLAGLGWGFLVGFILGVIFAFVYNFFLCCVCRKDKEGEGCKSCGCGSKSTEIK